MTTVGPEVKQDMTALHDVKNVTGRASPGTSAILIKAGNRRFGYVGQFCCADALAIVVQGAGDHTGIDILRGS